MAKHDETSKPEPIAVDGEEAARLLSVSLRTWRTMDAGGKVPLPVKLGGRVLWNLAELRRWFGAGAPDRETWQTMKSEV